MTRLTMTLLTVSALIVFGAAAQAGHHESHEGHEGHDTKAAHGEQVDHAECNHAADEPCPHHADGGQCPHHSGKQCSHTAEKPCTHGDKEAGS